MKEPASPSNKYSLSPLGSRTSLLFVSLASVILFVIGLFPESTLMQWLKTKPATEASMALGLIPLGIWYITGLFIGIYVPLLFLILYQFRRWYRRLLVPYLVMCIIQMVTELIAASLLFPGFALIAGVIYTTYRIWQLQTAISILNQSVIGLERINVFLQNFLLFAAGFWMLNLVFLLSVVLQ